jgi:hypothetical protein
VNPTDPVSDDDLASVLAACDEALAGGDLPASGDEGLPPGQARLLRGLECVRLLRQVWPRQDSTLTGGTAPPPFVPPAPERLGRFRIDRELGRGGFGIVYLAFDPHLARTVALKVPRSDVLPTPALRERFRIEARAAAALDHPNIVAVHETGEADGVAYIAAAYCAGVTLANWLDGRPDGVPFPLAASLLAQLADGVDHAHRREVLHRDLKPSNVMLVFPDGDGGGDPEPKITDFGLARTLGAADSDLTATGAILGTPNYLAPEQADGKGAALGPAVDVYGLGTVLYELLTRRPPFVSDNVLETLRQVRAEDPIPPQKLRAQVPRDLETICLKCLEKEPGRRYPSAAALAADLRRFVNGEPIQARPPGVLGRAARWARRRPAVAGLLAVALGLTALGLAGVVWQWRLAEQRRERAEEELYARDISLAHHEWQAGHLDRAEELLAQCPPARRHWEWNYLKRLCTARVASIRADGNFSDLAFSPDDHTLASAGEARVVLWDAQTGDVVKSWPTPVFGMNRVAYSPDGARLAVGGRWFLWNDVPAGGTGLALLDIDAGTNTVPDARPRAVEAVAYSPDGRHLATATGGNPPALHVRDARSGMKQLSLTARSTVTKIAFSPDGRFFAVTGWDGWVVVWDAGSWKEAGSFAAHEGWSGTWTSAPTGRGWRRPGTSR